MRWVVRNVLAVWMLGSGAQAATLELAARDALTGAPLQASVQFLSSDLASSTHAPATVTLGGERRSIVLPSGHWTLHVSAADHRDLDLALHANDAPTTLLLDPLVEPSAFTRLAQQAAARPQARWLQGHVRRAIDGAPLLDARIEVDGRVAVSDAQGYFELELDSASATMHAPAEGFALRVHAKGYATYERSGLLRAPGAQHLVIALGGDTPAQASMQIGARELRGSTMDDATGNATIAARAPVPPFNVAVAPALLPPATIRVGYADAACTQSCCTGSCSNVCVLPLETYVRRGLDSEWIASWNTQSLRAGSVAYRSYGAWRVAHPINANFDICSSACCQVNDAGTSSSTDAAIARTPGLMLTRSGSDVAAAEYSAENNSWDDPGDGLACSNNDLSCGNGYAGSPANGWPCLTDSVGAGHGCFGHGRGMSQWGTQRWAINASPKAWPWIVDHYYNDNADTSGAGSGQRTAVMTSPLVLSGVTLQPATAAPGTTLQISAGASNHAGATHAHILVGASLYRSGSGYVDDTANDVAITLPAGSNAIERAFHIPAATVAGTYNLLLSLYLDVDENAAIGAGDLPLALITLSQAVQVVGDRIFADAFESAVQ